MHWRADWRGVVCSLPWFFELNSNSQSGALCVIISHCAAKIKMHVAKCVSTVNEPIFIYLIVIFSGNCCWAFYAKNNFKGRPMLLGGHISLKNVSKWGWGGSSKIRSIRRLDSCDLD
jgi:hypothetical protein